MNKFTACLCMLSACVAWGADDPEWDVVYTGRVHPRQSTPKWSGNEGPNTAATVTAEGLHIVDRGTVGTNLRCYSRPWPASPEHPGVVEAEVRIVACTSRAGQCILVANGVKEEVVTLYPDRIVLGWAKLEHAMDTTNRFHTYRVRIGGKDVAVWVDGRLVIDGRGALRRDAHHGRRLALFGSLSSASLGEGFWRAVRMKVELPPAPPLPGARHVVIYKKQDVYACFPNIVQLPTGRLAVNFGTRVRRSHIDGTGGSATYVSDDHGETWRQDKGSYSSERHHMPWGGYLRCGAGGWKNVPAPKREELEAQGLVVRKVREGVVAHGGRPGWVRTSKDGQEWDTRTLPTPKMAFMQCYGPPGLLVTRREVVLYTVYAIVTREGERASLVMRSADRGRTWTFETISGPLPQGFGFSETALFENDRGEVGALLRPSPEAPHNTYLAFSSDDGKTWGPARDAGFWGYPCHVLRLRSGALVCSYGYRRGRMGIRCRVSRDGGHTWGEEIVLRSDGWGSGSDLGYPRSVQLPDGHVLTVYYINCRDNITHVACTHWDVP